jgi:diguanylate cyclase (GGDEF)-like protein/PAS domain S-box-containing protein
MRTAPDLASENAALRERLEEAEAVLAAVRSGSVDALVTGAPGSRNVFTLEGAETPYRSFVEAMHEGAARVDALGCILYANEALARLLGRPLKSVIGCVAREMFVPERREEFDGLLRSGKAAGAQRPLELLGADGSGLPALVTVAPLGGTGDIALVASDLRGHERGAEAHALLEQSERSRRALLSLLEDHTRAEQVLRRTNRALKTLSAGNEALVRATDEAGLLQEMVRVLNEIGGYAMGWVGYALDDADKSVEPKVWFGWDPGGLEGRPVSWADNEHGQTPVGRAIRLGQTQLIRDVQAKGATAPWPEFAQATNARVLLALPLRVALGQEPLGVLGLASSEALAFDADEVKLLEELAGDLGYGIGNLRLGVERRVAGNKLEYLAYYDQVTGLPNRAKFHERLERSLRGAERDGSSLAVLMFDIERFRTINETFGRAAGDELLQQVAERFTRQFGDAGSLARFGADHFACVILQAPGRDALARSFEQAYQDLFAVPFQLSVAELRISAKAGVAVFPDDGVNADTLLKGAEAALNRAKSSGERYQFFAREMTERVADNLTLENKLRQGLEKDQFVLHYQPKVDLHSGAIAGLEALIRWQSPELGLVPPMKFIPLLEQTGLILEVGGWALGRAAADHRRWSEAGLKPPRVAVNVSSIQLRQRDFVSRVEQAVMQGVAPVAIDLEITESVIMHEVQATIAKLKEARALGLEIAIDDFGTGYSSLAYLAKLPVQTLKIDRAFISAMLDDANSTTLVQTIISMAHSMRLKVVAEGVETEEQARMLRLLRCDQMQGYLFSKPVPAAAIATMLGEVAARAGQPPQASR